MEVSKESVIKDLKVLRLLGETLQLIGNGRAFYWDHTVDYFDGINDSPCDFSFVLCTMAAGCDGNYRNEQKAAQKLEKACVFVSPKEKDEFKRLASQLVLHRMFPERGPDRYKRLVLPTLIKMIDLALPEEPVKKDELKEE